MRDMNDMYVGDNCNIAIHCRDHVFTVSELFEIAQLNSTQEEWDDHAEERYEKGYF